MTLEPQPGDFAVVSVGGTGGAAISLLESIAYRHRTDWDHAFLYLGDGLIFQAEPGGAVTAKLGSYGHIIWSTGLLTPTAEQRSAIVAAAYHYAALKTGYSWADYAAIGAHRLHLPVPGLRRFIARSDRMICSQAVDACYKDGGVQLFADGRWPGYVSPYDLGTLLQRKAAKIVA